MSSTLVLLALAGAVALGGCASMNSVSSDVSSYGDWPAQRAAGRYAFERLPSQQSQPEAMDAIEGAAAGALERAGFSPAPPGVEPDVLVQVGLRTARADVYPWADPLWWRGGFGYWRHGPWSGPRWGFGLHFDNPRYEREVALLIRDRATGKPLFESRASHESASSLADRELLSAMFTAALMDFPRTGVNPRRVVVPLP